ncbi:MAG TPA: peptide deformylase [Candidatus Binatia bacterium]
MAVLEILKYPDPLLRNVSKPVDRVTDDTVRLLEDMVETMYAAPGVGLAAPQVGRWQRLIVLDIDYENPGKKLIKLINPEIRRTEGEVVWEEGCLSVPEYTAEVERGAFVEVAGLDEREGEIKIEAEGLLAVALQHEIDHLDGKLFIDYISRLKRELYTRKLKKKLREGKPSAETRPVLI